MALAGLLVAILAGCFTRQTFQDLDWNFLVFFAVALSIANLSVELQMDQAMAGLISPVLGQLGASPLLFVLTVAVLMLVIRLVLDPFQAVILLTLVLVPVASALDIDPWVVVVTLLATTAMWYFPSQTSPYLIAYSASEGRLFSHAQARSASFVFTGVILLALALTVPIWHLMGLL